MGKLLTNKKRIGQPKWYTPKEVFGRTEKIKKFRHAYNYELLRLSLARQVREIRKKKNLTQKEVAQRANMTQSIVARMEKGREGISVDTLGRIVSALGKNLTLK